jgi:hypothetical protein
MGTYKVATVRRGLINRKVPADALSSVGEVCKAGAQCKAVQNSKMAAAALDDLQTALSTANTGMASLQAKKLEYETAERDLERQMRSVKRCLSVYETAVDKVADGDAKVIGDAGLEARTQKPPATLEPVVGIETRPGKRPCEAYLSWPVAPGATSYAVQVSLAVDAAAPSWNELGTGTSRQRVLKAPTPGAQMLAQVASVARDGTRSAWSNPVLVTTR